MFYYLVIILNCTLDTVHNDVKLKCSLKLISDVYDFICITLYAFLTRQIYKFKKLISNCRSFGLDIRKNLIVYSLQHAKLKKVEGSLNNGLLVGSLSRYYTSLREFSSLAESVKTHFSCIEGVEFNRVEYIVSVLHESARSFSKAVESLGVSRCGPELTMAWIGKDVHEWHRRIAYQVHEIGIYGSQLLASLLLPHHSPILSSNS